MVPKRYNEASGCISRVIMEKGFECRRGPDIQAKPYRFVERHEDTDELNKIKQTELNFFRLDVVR